MHSFFGGVVLTVVRRLKEMYSGYEGSMEVCCTLIVVETYFWGQQCTVICIVGFSGLSVSIALFYAWELNQMMSHRNPYGSFWTNGTFSVKRLCLRCGGL